MQGWMTVVRVEAAANTRIVTGRNKRKYRMVGQVLASDYHTSLKLTVNDVPLLISLFTEIVPPNSSTMDFTM